MVNEWYVEKEVECTLRYNGYVKQVVITRADEL